MAKKTYRIYFNDGSHIEVQADRLRAENDVIFDAKNHAEVQGVWLRQAEVRAVVDRAHLKDPGSPQESSSS